MKAEREARDREPDDVRVIWDLDEDVIDLSAEADEDRIVDLTALEVVEEPAGSGADPARARRHARLIRTVLVTVDALCITVALLVAHTLRFGVIPERDYQIGIVVAIALWIGVFHALGLYAPQHLSGLEEFRRTISAVGIGIVLVVLVTFWFDVYVSRSWMALTPVIALVLELTARRIVRAYERRRSASEFLVMRTLVVGNEKDAVEPLAALKLPHSGFLAIGLIDVSNLPSSAEAPALERVGRVREVFRRFRPDCILIASPTMGAVQMVAVMQAARQEGILVRVYTHLSGVIASRLTAQRFGRDGIVLTLKPATLTGGQRVFKRGMDIVLSALVLIVVSPVLLAAAIAIKTTSRGPLLFQQERVTKEGRTFTMYKLRTMMVDDGAYLRARAGDTSVPFFKHASDPRLTPVGRWLRKWSIDELPQLVNVLRGEMSMVGPRALAAEQVDANVELLGPRHEVRSGITGWWQIHGRSDVDPEEAVRLDQFYIENWSPGLDAYILLKTMGVVLRHKGAY